MEWLPQYVILDFLRAHWVEDGVICQLLFGIQGPSKQILANTLVLLYHLIK